MEKSQVAAGLPPVRVHDLKHTFRPRLSTAGVSFADRQDLLGHRSGWITTHHSQVEPEELLVSANKVCGGKSRNGDIEKEIALLIQLLTD